MKNAMFGENEDRLGQAEPVRDGAARPDRHHREPPRAGHGLARANDARIRVYGLHRVDKRARRRRDAGQNFDERLRGFPRFVERGGRSFRRQNQRARLRPRARRKKQRRLGARVLDHAGGHVRSRDRHGLPRAKLHRARQAADAERRRWSGRHPRHLRQAAAQEPKRGRNASRLPSSRGA